MADITSEYIQEQQRLLQIGKEELVTRQRQLAAELKQVVSRISANDGAIQACDMFMQQLQNNDTDNTDENQE